MTTREDEELEDSINLRLDEFTEFSHTMKRDLELLKLNNLKARQYLAQTKDNPQSSDLNGKIDAVLGLNNDIKSSVKPRLRHVPEFFRTLPVHLTSDCGCFEG